MLSFFSLFRTPGSPTAILFAINPVRWALEAIYLNELRCADFYHYGQDAVSQSSYFWGYSNESVFGCLMSLVVIGVVSRALCYVMMIYGHQASKK